jgi:hypothetical protein
MFTNIGTLWYWWKHSYGGRTIAELQDLNGGALVDLAKIDFLHRRYDPQSLSRLRDDVHFATPCGAGLLLE